MDSPLASNGPSRRAVLAGSAWAVPAIIVTTTTPAFAASADSRLTVTTPNMQTVAAGTTPATATATDNAGQPLTGGVVTFTGPTGTSFSPQNATVSNGVATTTLNTTDTWATPGSTLTVTATRADVITTAALTVLGANAYALGASQNGASGTGPSGSGATLTSATQLLTVFPSPIVQISTGVSPAERISGHTLALLQDGTVWAVGANNYGQLGDGTTRGRTSWMKVPDLSGVTQVIASGQSSFAIQNGALMSWGRNLDGTLGDGTSSNRSTPGPVTGLTNGVTHVHSVNRYGYAIADGRAYAWGPRSLGNGTTSGSTTPVEIDTLNGVTDICGSAGGAAYAIADGTLYSWGSNGSGQLGNGTFTDTTTPTPVALDVPATRVSAGSHFAMALSNGRVYSWGRNDWGQLGNGTVTINTSSAMPTVIPSLTSVTAISALGVNGSCIDGGVVKAWGYNSDGRLGDGTTTTQPTPLAIPNVTGVTALSNSSHGTVFHFIR